MRGSIGGDIRDLPDPLLYRLEHPGSYRRTWHAKVVRPPRSLLGPFGGGWKWCLGLNVGPSKVVLNLVRFYIRWDLY